MASIPLPLRPILAASLALSLAACTQPSSTPPPDASTSTDTALALTGEGLFLVEPDSGSTTLLPFGMEMETVQAAVIRHLGRPLEISTNAECPGDPFVSALWAEGLVLNADGEEFVGWSVRPEVGSDQFTTLAGIGVGSSREDLEAAYTVTVVESTIGTEFTAGQLAGLLSDPTPAAEITDFWAGTVCIFR
ncbi:hypothetical protein [Phormidium sp. FACHB-1136]|jgi:hypothetical protein|uniref:hypothetical protein n=1 Tax=Phormidium sp. FACHB-1136 TaxID=2692848 RepID=UPI0016875B6B|nr:hypothetical protein [Phormidium sp. FACHB-1136]MBD2424883.1 hypothetical protein [Phormidium sp. FACHB-1136]